MDSVSNQSFLHFFCFNSRFPYPKVFDFQFFSSCMTVDMLSLDQVWEKRFLPVEEHDLPAIHLPHLGDTGDADGFRSDSDRIQGVSYRFLPNLERGQRLV